MSDTKDQNKTPDSDTKTVVEIEYSNYGSGHGDFETVVFDDGSTEVIGMGINPYSIGQVVPK